MHLLKAKYCLIQIDCPFNYSCDAEIKFYPVLLAHSGIYMQTRHMSVYTCNSEGWKNNSRRVNRNFVFTTYHEDVQNDGHEMGGECTSNRGKERRINVLLWDVMACHLISGPRRFERSQCVLQESGSPRTLQDT